MTTLTLAVALHWPSWAVWLIAIFFLLVAGVMVLTVLIQRPQGGGLSGAFGSGAGSGQTAFGAKTGDALTIFTIIVFVVFLLTAVLLNYAARSRFVVGGEADPAETAAPGTPGTPGTTSETPGTGNASPESGTPGTPTNAPANNGEVPIAPGPAPTTAPAPEGAGAGAGGTPVTTPPVEKPAAEPGATPTTPAPATPPTADPGTPPKG